MIVHTRLIRYCNRSLAADALRLGPLERGAMKIIIHEMPAHLRQLALLAVDAINDYPESKSMVAVYGKVDKTAFFVERRKTAIAVRLSDPVVKK